MTMGLSNTQPHSHSRSHGIIGNRSHSHSHGHGSHDHERLIETLQSEGEYLTCLGHIFVDYDAHTCHILRYSLPFSCHLSYRVITGRWPRKSRYRCWIGCECSLDERKGRCGMAYGLGHSAALLADAGPLELLPELQEHALQSAAPF